MDQAAATAAAAKRIKGLLEEGTEPYLDFVRAANKLPRLDEFLESDSEDISFYLISMDHGVMPMDRIAPRVFEAAGIGEEMDDGAELLAHDQASLDLYATGFHQGHFFRLWTLVEQPAFGVLILWDSEDQRVMTVGVRALTS